MDDSEREVRRSAGPRRSAESAEAILEAATQLLAEKGYAGFSIEAVARRARAGKQTIYRWWPSKTALLLDVYDRRKREIDYEDTGDVEEDLSRFVITLMRLWRETPLGEIFRSIIAGAQSSAEAETALGDYASERRARIAGMVEGARARGEVGANVDPLQVADFVAAYAWTHLLTGRLNESEADTRAAVSTLVHGILHRS